MEERFTEAQFKQEMTLLTPWTLVKIPLRRLKDKFFVRAEMPHGVAKTYQRSYETEGITGRPPIRVSPNFEVIDGRIRRFAAENAQLSELWAKVEPQPKDDAAFIERAYILNLNDGPSAPTEADTIHVFRSLFRKGQAKHQVLAAAARFGFSPKVALTLVEWAYATIRRDRKVHFLHLVDSENMTKAEAAKTAGISIRVASNLLAARGGGIDPDPLKTIHMNMKNKFKATQDALMKGALKMEEAFFSGSKPVLEVNDYYALVTSLAKELERVAVNRKQRFDGKVKDLKRGLN